MLTDKVFVIAELSGNHNKNLQYTKDTIYSMKESGADAVKLQTYTADSLTLDVDNDIFGPRQEGLWKGKRPYEVFDEGALPYEWHQELFDYARELGLVCFSSPFDFEAVELLESIGNPIYKVASFEIRHIPLIEKISQTGKPVIISTGIATVDDIATAISYFNKKDVTLLKCTSAYPTPYSQVNLNMMTDLREMFGVKVGLSDHTLGATVPIAACALGAKVVEKHYILDRKQGGIDSDFSMSPKEFKQMVEGIRIVEESLGDRKYSLSAASLQSRERGRSIFVSKNVRKGDVLTPDNISIVRPASGIAPEKYYEVLGKVFVSDIKAGTPLEMTRIQ